MKGEMTRINQVVRNCTLILNEHHFLIDLIPYDIGSFDVIVGMDWMRAVRAEIECYEKVVKIPLPSGKVLRVQGETSEAFESKVYSSSAKRVELKTVPVVCDFPDIFPDDLPRLPPSRQLDFRITLVPNAMPMAKSPYRLATSELQELES